MTSESQKQKPDREVPMTPALTQEIERALEMMRRVRTAQLAQGQGEAVETPGNRYELPEPLVFRVSGSSEGE